MNKEQQEFYDYIENCYNNVYTGKVLLDSPAGTGKTFTISHIYKNMDCKILAPTHKAVSILSQSGIEATTIHKFLCWSQEINENGEHIDNFNYKMSYILKDLPRILIIDECSMLSDKIISEILEFSKHTLIVFVGDKAQLPPVKEETNRVFTMEHKRVFNFHVNMRINNGDENVACLISKYREGVLNNQLPIIKGYKDYRMKIDDFEKKIKEIYDNEPDTMYISYSNNDVNRMNEKIRNIIHADKKVNGVLPDYCEGEKLLFSGYYKTEKHTYYSNERIKIEKVECVDIFMPYDTYIRCKGKNVKFYKITDQYDNVFYKPYKSHYCQFLKVKKNKYDYAKLKCSKAIWKSYYNWLNKYDSDIKGTYAITVYKSQGSGYKNVIVNITNIIRCCNTPSLLRRSVYTAVSRSKNKLIIVYKL